jgi:hypothetical protein
MVFSNAGSHPKGYNLLPLALLSGFGHTLEKEGKHLVARFLAAAANHQRSPPNRAQRDDPAP